VTNHMTMKGKEPMTPNDRPKTFRTSIERASYSRDPATERTALRHNRAEIVTHGTTFLGIRCWATMSPAERRRHDEWVEDIHDAYARWQMETPTIRRLVRRRLSEVVHIDRAEILQAIDASIKVTIESMHRLE
jgi:hypothetical protein